MARGYKGVDARSLVPKTSAPTHFEIDVMDLTKGLRGDISPLEMPHNASPALQDVRFEGTGVRKDFGWAQVGNAASSKILGMREHRYFDASGNEISRLFRVVRQIDGEAQVDIWDGTDWDDNADSSNGGETINDGLVSSVSTLGNFFVAGGADDILYYSESPSFTTREDDFPTVLQISSVGQYAQVALANEPSFDDNYTISYEVDISLKWDGVGSAAEFLADVSVRLSNDGFSSSSVTVDSRGFGVRCTDQVNPCTLQYIQTGAVRVSVDAASAGIPDVTHVRVYIDSITQSNVASLSWNVHACNKATDGDSFGGAEYQTLTATRNLLTVGTSCPHARYVFAFADRLVAIGDASAADTGEQTVIWSTSGDAISNGGDAWADDGYGTALLQDTQADPVNEILAGVALSNEIGALFRKRSIMRMIRTGNATAAIAFLSWFENVGTESPHSVRPVRGGAMFLGSDLMPYLISASGQLTPVGVPIHEVLITNVTSKFDLVYAEYDPIFEEYWLGVPLSGASFLGRAYIFSLKDFYDKQEVVWRQKNFPVPISCFTLANNYPGG